MSAMWAAMKRSCHCKDKPDVHKPKPREGTGKRSLSSSSSSCRCRVNEVTNGSKKPTNRSPLSIRSSDLMSPYTDIVKFSSSDPNLAKDHDNIRSGGSPVLSPQSRPGQHFKGGFHSLSRAGSGSEPSFVWGSSFQQWLSVAESSSSGCFMPSSCDKCGKPLIRQDVEEHHLSKHADKIFLMAVIHDPFLICSSTVSEVQEGDPSGKIIEMTVKAGWTNSDNCLCIESILKVHNPQPRLVQFKEYREMVKIRAHRLLEEHSRKHSRCLADGNELHRFYATTVACPLGRSGILSLCSMQECNLCCVLRHGFSSRKGLDQSVLGVFTTSTGERAYKSLEMDNGGEARDKDKGPRKALIVCRVIAGRVHKPIMENLQMMNLRRRLGFDSLAGKMGSNGSYVEELYLFNPTALLPCFVIICK
ncbi:hypothetical protein Cgig2_031398 [Carnegiea gigantea]|uniref:C2H2-type domain-containing protein n=1 Tax=Carnegiea gigantea TaxID=171969 RepID=A0A9Q1K7R7_9CARY|nr:hypothetical protein Cgig2_031398 [Carnegiea gigantea]